MMRRLLKSHFTVEWCGLTLLALVGVIWSARIQFHLHVSWRDGELVTLALIAILGLRLMAQRLSFLKKGNLIAEYFLLTTVATMVFGVLSYLALASSGALVDKTLLAADRALGFDWLAGYQFLRAHSAYANVLQFAYNSMIYQALYFGVLMTLMDRKGQLHKMFWLVFAIGMFTLAGVILFPALGPLKVFSIALPDSFVPVMEHLHSRHDLNFVFSKMTGVVSFPSFHTAMAFTYVWGFRRTGIIGWIIAGLNLVMLGAIPWFGGHYMVDMIAGAAAMLTALALVTFGPRLRISMTAPLPEALQGAGAATGRTALLLDRQQ